MFIPSRVRGVHVVEVDPVLLHRLKIASVWLRLEQDERLSSGDLSHIKQVQNQEQAFGSSAGLYNGVYMFDAYVAPLMAALAPGIWGFNVVRTFGSLIFSVGRSVAGTYGDAAEMLQLISLPGADEVTPIVPLSEDAAADAIEQ